MESVNTFLHNLNKTRECRRRELSEMEKLKKEETEKIIGTLNQFRDDRKRCTKTIDTNLSSITSLKYSIHKSVQETRDDTVLPISNLSRTHALNFFNDAVIFINDQSENSSGLRESNIDTEELLSKIQTSIKNTETDFVTIKNKVEAIETVIANIPVLSSYVSSMDKEEESQLETTMTDFVSNRI